MKRVYISAALLAVTAFCCTAALNHIEKTALRITEQAELIITALQNGDAHQSRLAMDEIDMIWEEERQLFHMIAGNQGCDRLEESLRRSRVFVVYNKKSPEAISELLNLILSTERILRSQRPGFINLL